MKEWQTGWRNDRPSASFGGVTWSMTPTTRRHKPFRWRLRSFLHVEYLVLISHHHHHHHYRHHYHHQVACSSNSITAQLSALFNKLQSHKHCKRPWTQKNSKNAETWNSLPAELRLSTLSTATFARRLKAHLFVSTEWHVLQRVWFYLRLRCL